MGIAELEGHCVRLVFLLAPSLLANCIIGISLIDARQGRTQTVEGK